MTPSYDACTVVRIFPRSKDGKFNLMRGHWRRPFACAIEMVMSLEPGSAEIVVDTDAGAGSDVLEYDAVKTILERPDFPHSWQQRS